MHRKKFVIMYTKPIIVVISGNEEETLHFYFTDIFIVCSSFLLWYYFKKFKCFCVFFLTCPPLSLSPFLMKQGYQYKTQVH